MMSRNSRSRNPASLRCRVSAAILQLLSAVPALAAEPVITIRDPLWGFDGSVMRDRFVPLTFIVDNASPEPFDGELRLYRGNFSGARVGGFNVQTIYLAPGTQRIVQFYPLVLSDMETWTLAWDGGEFSLPKPRFGGPARVLLADDRDLFNRGGAVKRFREKFFPPYATATDTLGSVVMDHAPDWEAPRRQAFLDWLRQGGELHLIVGPNGKQPEFTSDLAVLNQPSDVFQIGSGRVRRHAVGRSGLTSGYVSSQLDRPPRPPDETPEEIERGVQGYQAYSYPLDQWQMTQGAFNQLKRMVKAEHDWAVIHLLSLSYVAVLFPGCFLIGREFRHVPATFGAILGSTLLFGGAFYQVGNRGYGESTTVHAVALAEHIEKDRYDVTEWSSIFAIAGGNYALSNPGSERLYSDATDNERIEGRVTAGSAGRLVADVPPYSTRVMAHKSIVQSPGITAPRLVADPGGTGQTVFQVPATFPAVNEVYAIIDRKVFTYRRSGNLLRPIGQGTRLKEFLKISDSDFAGNVGIWQEETDADTRLTKMIRPLMLYSLRITTDDELKSFYLPEGRALLYAYAPLTAPFQTLSGEAATEGDAEPAPPVPLPEQSGGVLYCFDLET